MRSAGLAYREGFHTNTGANGAVLLVLGGLLSRKAVGCLSDLIGQGASDRFLFAFLQGAVKRPRGLHYLSVRLHV